MKILMWIVVGLVYLAMGSFMGELIFGDDSKFYEYFTDLTGLYLFTTFCWPAVFVVVAGYVLLRFVVIGGPVYLARRIKNEYFYAEVKGKNESVQSESSK